MRKFLASLREARDLLFLHAGVYRETRILVITTAIAFLWIFVDVVTDNYKINYWHDVCCIVLAVLIERLLPWGKRT